MKKAPTLITLLLISFLTSCSLFRSIIIEEDEVFSSSRIRTEFEYRGAREWNSPLQGVTQTILRETGKDSLVGIRIFDRIQMNAKSYRLENKVYLIIDGKPYQAKVDGMEFERLSSIQEKRNDVLTADSTKVSVVTGYDRSESNSYKMSYTVNPDIVEKIKSCGKLYFRYYAGPDMITTTMSRFELKTLRKMLEL